MAKKTDTPEQAPGQAERPQAPAAPLPPDTVTEPEPKPAPLVQPKAPDGKAKEDRPPVAPTAEPSPAPRSVHQNLRAPEGLRRFKIVCRGYGEVTGLPLRYVLAENEAQARAHYLRISGLDGIRARLGEGAPEPQLVVTALRD